jgi:aminopeptidase N
MAVTVGLMFACTPKSGTKTSSTPTAPEEPTQWVEPKPLIGGEVPDTSGVEPVEYQLLGGVDISPKNIPPSDSLPPYNPAHTHQIDLVHERVEISFDWTRRRANGKATLTIRPWFYTTEAVHLDAKNFDIQSVTLEPTATPLKYTYDNEQLRIQLAQPLTRGNEIKITVTYTAKPDERTDYGGSAAITQDKGLYFINPDGADPTKPRQIWTQGETESNSYWMPTVDKPNERCTQEMYITVEDNFKTLSNGLLIASTRNANGTRTDYWRQDQPHAPYLFMMAVGEFAVVKDKWRNMDVDYYVEPAYEAYARDIFPYTPEMLDFFSKKLGVDYPWKKYAQVVVRDYVSGAMENTTAVIFGEFMQKDRRQLLDAHLTNEKIVAHEMFHHWFGDLVTTESWANLTLNEGFANYSEYLWMEHKHGRDAADHHLQMEQQGYLFSAGDGGHPLIHYGYGNREDMFDAHSYNKGGCILHMLRGHLGDDAFFEALKQYLNRHQYTAVEAHELRMAFEDVTGQDLNWFFDQWFFAAGHPALNISYAWDEATKTTKVTIEQEQVGDDVPYVFDLPLAVDVYDASGQARRERIRVTKRTQVFSFKSDTRPALVNVDAEKNLLCVKTDNHTQAEWAFMYQYAPLYRDRAEALAGLDAENPTSQATYRAALGDKFYQIRADALNYVQPTDPTVLAAVARMAENDPEPGTRAQAISLLGQSGDRQYIPLITKGLDPNNANSVLGASFAAIKELDPATALAAAKTLENIESEDITVLVAELYATQPQADQLAWFEQRAGKVDQMAAFGFFEHYQQYLVGLQNETALGAALATWQANALTPKNNSEWRRFASTKAIADTRNMYRDAGNKAKAAELDQVIKQIVEQETDPTLKLYYGMF